MILALDVAPVRGFVSLPVFAVSRRLFNSPSPEHHSRKIYHPCVDGIFQYGFESHIALINFLNAALDFKGGKEIQNIEYIKKEMPTAGFQFTVYVRC